MSNTENNPQPKQPNENSQNRATNPNGKRKSTQKVKSKKRNHKKKKDEGNKELRLLIEKIVLNDTEHSSYNYKMLHAKVGKSLYSSEDLIKAVNILIERGFFIRADNRIILAPKNKKSSPRPPANLPAEVVGLVDMTASGAAYILSELAHDVYVPAAKTKRALNGDRVRVRLLPHYSKARRGKLEGEIIEVLERSQEEFVGIIKISKRFAFLIPDKVSLKVDFFIPLDSIGNAKDGDKVLVKVVDWTPKDQKNPIAKVSSVLGKPGENNVEMLSILADNGFHLSFSPALLREANKLTTEIPAEEIAQRRDMRSVPTFTIDPHDAKDFDDALSLQKLDNGNWEIGVHIADVTHYIPHNSGLDREAYKRGTSVYLVDRVLPMFPEKISNEVCSLRPNEDKLCFSGVFELNDRAEIVGEWWGKTVIYSDKRFSYSEAQKVLDTQEGEFLHELQQLDRLAKILRQKRTQDGSINFASDEVKFQLDENGKPIGVHLKVMLDTNRLIEEYMLLANRRVAAFIRKQNDGKIPFANRVHDVPDMDKLKDFSRFAALFGHKLQFDSPKQVAHTLNKLLADIKDKPEERVLSSLAIRSMAKAAYSTKNIGHYGLAFNDYAHFTSPIRRYPDIMVHRVLGKLLYPEIYGKINYHTALVEEQCEHASMMERKAMTAERQSSKYKQVEYMSEHIGEEFYGIISGVVHFGFFVELENIGCEGLIRLENLIDDNYFFDESSYAIIGRAKGRKYRLGDKVLVRVIKTDMELKTIDFDLIKHIKLKTTP